MAEMATSLPGPCGEVTSGSRELPRNCSGVSRPKRSVIVGARSIAETSLASARDLLPGSRTSSGTLAMSRHNGERSHLRIPGSVLDRSAIILPNRSCPRSRSRDRW